MDFPDYKPNDVNPQSRAGLVMSVNTAAAVVATIFVSMRLFARIRILHAAGWDDLAATVATFIFIIAAVLSCMAKYGLGKHIWDVKPENIPTLLKLSIFIGTFYNLAMMSIKLSILLFYLRIFSSPTFRKFVYGTIALTIGIAISFTLVHIMKCLPVPYYWDRTIPGGKCINLTAFHFSNAAFSISTDLWIWALPIPILSSLGLNRRKKYALLFVFSLGLFTCVASILRLHILRDAATITDPSWGNGGINIWSQIELSTAITCACLPPMRPLLSQTFKGIFNSSRGTYGNSSNQPRSQNIYALRSLRGVPEGSLVPKGSEEEILSHIGTGSAMDIEDGIIKKTVDVTVSSEER